MKSLLSKTFWALIFILFFTLILPAMLTVSVYAEEVKSEKVSIYLGQWSKHQRPKYYYNEKHYLKGIEYKDFHYSNFINSENDKTHMLAYTPEFYESQYLDFGLIMGIVHGYRDTMNFPVIIPSFTLHYKSFPVKLQINYIPTALVSGGFVVDF